MNKWSPKMVFKKLVVPSKKIKLVILVMLTATCGEHDMNSFTSRRAVRTHKLHLEASIDQVFPLFDPINEKKWAADWNFKPVFPNPAAVEQGFVFTTKHHLDPETVWVLSKLDRENHAIEYTRFEPDSKVVQIQIRCVEGPDVRTTAIVTYIQTALTEKGNESVAEFTEDHYKQWMAQWEQAINHYLHTGEALTER